MGKAASAMDNPRSDPSLIAYLQPQSDDALRINLIGTRTGWVDRAKGEPSAEGLSSGSACTMPFSEIDTCGPFARMLPADLTMGRGHALLPLFLVIQADRYAAVSSELNPVYNQDVEACWRNALTCYDQHRPAGFPQVPACQKDDQGEWRPFRPLFFCGMTDQFCHPHCPACGGELDLCRDDHLLETCGLPGFSRSLERFLFCPSCRQASSPLVFYAHTIDLPTVSLKQGAQLRDSLELLQDFGRLQLKDDLAGKFPCVGCAHGAECYGPDHRVASRMTPVSFFPFYMLVSPAPDLNLTEFVMLLSGAEFKEIASRVMLKQPSGRGRIEMIQRFQSKVEQETGVFFTEGDRRFLEVLYLKLTLIQEMMTLSRDDPGILNMPMERLSLEGFWVSLSDSSRRLPFLWGFDLKTIDVIGESSCPDLDKYRGRRFLGLAWLNILLANRRQDAKTIHACITGFLRRGENIDPEHPIPDDMKAVLAPSNLFWASEPIDLDGQWEFFWRKALFFGIGLLQSGMSADADWRDQEFDEKITELRRDIRIALFQTDWKSVPTAATEQTRDDRKIAAIVDDILRRWPAKPDDHGDLHAPDVIGDVEETVILATEQGGKGVVTRKTIPSSATSAEVSSEQPDVLEQTIVVRRPPETTDPDLEKTRIIYTSELLSNDEDDKLDKTVVVSPHQPESPDVESRPEPDQVEPDPSETVQLDKTVVTKRPSIPSEDLEKTMIIDSRQWHDRKPKP